MKSCRKNVKCTICRRDINRQTWNYGKNRPIEFYFCDNICKGKWQRLQREKLGYTKKWLKDQYLKQGKSADQIAREIGRDAKRVWEWLHDYGIKKRPRGSDYGNLFKEGQESAFKGMRHKENAKQKIREARLRDGHVPYLKDGKHWLKHEGAINPTWKGGITPERQSFYASLEWVEVVKKVWKRDAAKCRLCGKEHNTITSRGKFAIHHIVSFQVKEIRAELTNLVLLCRDCHLWVHSRKNVNKIFIKENRQ